MRSSHISNKQVFRRPTSSTKVCYKQEINTTIGHGKVTNEQIFKIHVENIELKNEQNCLVSNADVTNQQAYGDNTCKRKPNYTVSMSTPKRKTC